MPGLLSPRRRLARETAGSRKYDAIIHGLAVMETQATRHRQRSLLVFRTRLFLTDTRGCEE